MIAFALAKTDTGRPYNDPRVVKWFATFWNFISADEQTFSEVPMHTCTEDDFAKFYPPDDHSEQQVQEMRDFGAFQCVDWAKSGIILQGGAKKSLLDISVGPCHFKETNIGGAEDYIRDDCILDR